MTMAGEVSDRLVCCVDVGSTFTKAALVEVTTGALLATASHLTTLTTDVMEGYDACRTALQDQVPASRTAPARLCSSAGGGLRIAVVGTEALVTAEAGRRVALSSGGSVVAVLAGGLADQMEELVDARPDMVLLVGGTDGGNSEVLRADAAALGRVRWPGPVVVAGDASARDEVARLMGQVPHVLAGNVVPRIGVLAPADARRAVREVFLRHVIGGKDLSRRADFTALVRGATPDVVLGAVELLARGHDAEPGVGEVVVVDVGGATTDVHSVIELDPEDTALARDVIAPTPLARTVEGDLGMRWSATSTMDAAVAAGLLTEDAVLRAAVVRRGAEPDLLPHDEAEREVDRVLARAAVQLALRRHAGRARVVLGPDGRVVERSGTDLRRVALLVGSGGILRHARGTEARSLLAAATGPSPEGWQLPDAPTVVVDRHYVLAAVGLLAPDHPVAALRLARGLLLPVPLT